MASQEPQLGQPASRTSRQENQWLILLPFVVAAAVSGLGLCAGLIWVSRVFPPDIERHDFGAVARAFFRALLRDDFQTAASLTRDEQRPRLTAWTTAHQPFECPFRLILDDMEGEIYGAVGSRVDGSSEASYLWSYACTYEDYYFTVDDMALVLGADGEWIVVSWKACEKRRDSPETCDE